MDHHPADSTQDEVSEAENAGNRRNGYSKKTVLTENEATGDTARPARKFRAVADREVSAPISWIRRQDHLDVRAWHERAGDPGSFARSVWHRGLQFRQRASLWLGSCV